MSFDEYLKEQGFKSDTVNQHQAYIRYFLCWLTDMGIFLNNVGYSEILDFADSLKKEEKSINQINRCLKSIEYYFSYIKKENKITSLPISNVKLKGSIRNIPHDLLEKTELEELYEKYEIKDERTHRNKVILGLLVYQALTRSELEMLRPEHLKLREGKIHIPQTNKNNSRNLSLQPHQILDLQEYLLIVRPKLQSKTERLFTGRNDMESLKNSLLHLNHALRKINPKLKNAMQIRQSVITEWLKENNLRTVQYMAGHRYVSSTELYQTNNLEDLKEALNKHHPLK
ncbi:integrase/recombinase XerD [Pedobacter sp. AK013]|uniref:tyrosine-type recombinase/integrase n=1 Tax=Pedobacter sp. AK013 TaxID=2723071 RepID=UPI0016218CD0|nr:site-specific integrase [Pedobacter sp. AK013]MBB6239879.1 integrase/recombinase XerD [Pedobacter sp. AK013]